jgi:hypothetical protein
MGRGPVPGIGRLLCRCGAWHSACTPTSAWGETNATQHRIQERHSQRRTEQADRRAGREDRETGQEFPAGDGLPAIVHRRAPDQQTVDGVRHVGTSWKKQLRPKKRLATRTPRFARFSPNSSNSSTLTSRVCAGSRRGSGSLGESYCVSRRPGQLPRNREDGWAFVSVVGSAYRGPE